LIDRPAEVIPHRFDDRCPVLLERGSADSPLSAAFRDRFSERVAAAQLHLLLVHPFESDDGRRRRYGTVEQ
jgi:hypothetical protein